MVSKVLGRGHVVVDQRPGIPAGPWRTMRPLPFAEALEATARERARRRRRRRARPRRREHGQPQPVPEPDLRRQPADGGRAGGRRPDPAAPPSRARRRRQRGGQPPAPPRRRGLRQLRHAGRPGDVRADPGRPVDPRGAVDRHEPRSRRSRRRARARTACRPGRSRRRRRSGRTSPSTAGCSRRRARPREAPMQADFERDGAVLVRDVVPSTTCSSCTRRSSDAGEHPSEHYARAVEAGRAPVDSDLFRWFDDATIRDVLFTSALAAAGRDAARRRRGRARRGPVVRVGARRGHAEPVAPGRAVLQHRRRRSSRCGWPSTMPRPAPRSASSPGRTAGGARSRRWRSSPASPTPRSTTAADLERLTPARRRAGGGR